MFSIQHRSNQARTILTLLALLVAFVAATASRPAAGLAAPAEPPQLVFEPGDYDFGLRPVNSGSAQANFQLRNAGSEGVQVNSLQISGPGSGAFWNNSNCSGMYLQPSESCYVQVYFGPYDTSEYVAQLRADAGPYSFTADLSGTGGRAAFVPAANATDFGVAKVGSEGTTREIEITNAGNMPGGMFIAVIAGGAIGSFQILDENCTGVELIPAATCTLQIRFQPVSEGVKKAMLGLFGESEGPTPIVLTGVGSAPDPLPEVPPGAAAANTGVPVAIEDRKGKARWHKHRRLKGHRLRSAVGAARISSSQSR